MGFVAGTSFKSLETITIPNSVTSVGAEAFASCTGLKSVEIPDSVVSIGAFAFHGCSSLSKITIPESVESVGAAAFSQTAWYEGQPEGLVYAGKVLYAYKGTMQIDANIEIKEGIKGITDSAFSYCENLSSIKLPKGLINIGDSSFVGCTGLKSVEIPDTVVSIGRFAFDRCSNLSNITIPDSVLNITRNSFDGTAWYENMPEGLVYAGKVVYEYKGSMPRGTEIEIKEGTKAIAEDAFYSESLSKITIPDSVTTIGEGAFQYCTDLSNITIPSSVTTMGGWVFSSWESSQTINIQKYLSAPAGWSTNWNRGCYATINWNK